jgi:hypothetical protein
MDLFAQSYFLDRRSEPRQRVVNFVLKLDPCDGRAPIICAVWDISEGGTRLSWRRMSSCQRSLTS